MGDALTDRIAASVRTRFPFVIKYVPYGALSEVSYMLVPPVSARCTQAACQVMPYLARRAVENKSVLGNGHAAEERRQAFDALWKRLFGNIEGSTQRGVGHN
jgi:proline dehydrogenase